MGAGIDGSCLDFGPPAKGVTMGTGVNVNCPLHAGWFEADKIAFIQIVDSFLPH